MQYAGRTPRRAIQSIGPRAKGSLIKIWVRCSCLILLVLLMPLAGIGVQPTRAEAGATAVSLYVSPTGNDRNPGTRFAPLQTLARAQDMVRRLNQHMAGDITVYLRHGTYRLTQPLRLDARDSGSNGHTVIWRAGPGQDAVISGAERIAGWTLHDPSRDIWAAPVPRGLQTRQLYVNGMRAELAAGQAPSPLSRTPTGYEAASPIMAGWRNPSSIDFVYTAQLGLMAEPRCAVASIEGRTITMAQPCWDNSTRRSEIKHRRQNLVGFGTLTVPSYIENAYELLDQPGEFYLDGSAHTLYYIPRKGEDLRAADVEAPVLQSLVEGAGSEQEPIQHLTFAHLRFSDATWLRPSTSEGFSEVQANYTITAKHGYDTQGLCHLAPHGACPYGAWTKEPGAVQFHDDHHLTFLDDQFVHLGAAGLNLDNGSQDDVVAGSVFTDISGNGLEIGSVDRPDATGAAQTRAITVRDNHVYGLPVEYHGGVGILVGYAADTTITHNQLDHLSYTAISLGWGGWPDKIGQPPLANFSRNNVVSDNRISDFMQYLTDGGGIYTLGITGPSLSQGEKVTGNVIHDQLGWGRALLSDDGASFITYAGNALYNNTYDYCCPFHFNYRQGRNLRHQQFFAQVLLGNYWQLGDRDSSQGGVTEKGNILITGPEQVPAPILAGAGTEARSRATLTWQPTGESVPNPPGRVNVLYAFGGNAYVTWRPSFAAGNYAVASYTINACRAGGLADSARCDQTLTVAASQFMRLGYVVVPGLTDGAGYTFTVTATSVGGSSTPSIPSATVAPTTVPPGLPQRPTRVQVWAGRHTAAVSWYAPTTASSQPVLAYVFGGPGHRKSTVTGLRQLIVSNAKGRVLRVIGGLPPGRTYRFTIAAVTPAGVSPVVRSPTVVPGG